MSSMFTIMVFFVGRSFVISIGNSGITTAITDFIASIVILINVSVIIIIAMIVATDRFILLCC